MKAEACSDQDSVVIKVGRDGLENRFSRSAAKVVRAEFDRGRNQNNAPPRKRILHASILSLLAVPVLVLAAQLLRHIQVKHTRFLSYEVDYKPEAIIPQARCQQNGTGKRVVSMSLFGPQERYAIGALRNAEKMPAIYPGWILRIYANVSTVEEHILNSLKSHGAEIIDVEDLRMQALQPMMWRFLVAGDSSVSRFIVRDADSRISEREAACVQAWERSCLPFHVIRDHPSHSQHAISGGMWGAVRGSLPQLPAILEAERGSKSAYMGDMDLLRKHVWPIAQSKGVVQHDSLSCVQWGALPFPVARKVALL